LKRSPLLGAGSRWGARKRKRRIGKGKGVPEGGFSLLPPGLGRETKKKEEKQRTSEKNGVAPAQILSHKSKEMSGRRNSKKKKREPTPQRLTVHSGDPT